MKKESKYAKPENYKPDTVLKIAGICASHDLHYWRKFLIGEQ